MDDRQLAALIEDEVSRSIGSGGGTGAGAGSSDLATERAAELDYYNSKAFGNEREGESQVVTSDVFDAVEGMLPHLIKTFTASDDAVVFEPQGQEDEEAAKQRTDVANYVFYRQNNGFIIMYEWFKDALLQKNGVVKYWWEEKEDITEDEWQGLTEGEYLTLMKGEGIEEMEHSTYDDPSAVEQRDAMMQRLQSMPQQPAMMNAPPDQQTMMLQAMMAQPVPQLHDVKLRLTKDVSKICIKAIPPEEFGVSSKHNCISIQDAPFVYHKTTITISELRQMGCPEDVIADAGTAEASVSNKPESLARERFTDESTKNDSSDDSMKEFDITDCFIRIDYDDDGVAELRHIIKVGNAIWINEQASHINFAAITPIIMPHKFVGKSIAEIVMDVQFISSTLWRQMLNNLYLTNNPQKVVLGSQGGILMADIDRLMTSRVGGVLVEYAPNAIRNQDVPFVAGASFPMLEYMQGMKENRTGVTRYNQGTDADSLNKTARGIAMIQSAAQMKMDLIARIFAETGVKDLFRGIAYMLSKYSTKAMTIRLRGKWVDIDPRQWKTQYDMTVNVGLGSGNKDAQLVHLAKMNEVQLELMKTGRGHMVTDDNVYNLANKMAENMGFKHPDMFLTDPKKVQKPPPAPNPEMIKIQQADAEAKAKIQSNEKIRQFDAQTSKELESIKAQALIAIAQIDAETKKAIAVLHEKSTQEIAIFKANDAAQQERLALHQERQAFQTEKLGFNYDKNIHAISKQVEANPHDAVIMDHNGGVTQGIANTIQGMGSEFTQQVANVSATTGQAINSLASGQQQLAQAISQLAQAQIIKDKESKKRVHEVTKTDGGYRITSTVH